MLFVSGREITKAIIRMGGYQSISGNFIRIDQNGDSEGNFTAFALKEYNYTFVSRITGEIKFKCKYYPVKVGEFHSEKIGIDNVTNVITYSPKVNIDWPGNHKPVDEPHCGYDGAKCKGGKGGTEIAAGVLGGIFLFVIILYLSVLKRFKQEQEIEGLLWKINPDCLGQEIGKQVGKYIFVTF
jgi:guanylate cyclase